MARTSNDHLFDFFEGRSPDASYVLGLIFADGSMFSNNDSTCLQLTCVWEQRHLLEMVREVLLPVPEIREERIAGNHRARLRITSQQFCSYLRDRGFYPRKKTENHPFPVLDSSEFPHFVRGYFDGKGEVRVEFRYEDWETGYPQYEKGKVLVGSDCVASVYGTPLFLNGMADELVKWGLPYQAPTQRHLRRLSEFTLQWLDDNQIRSLYGLMYHQPGTHLFLRRSCACFEDHLTCLGMLSATDRRSGSSVSTPSRGSVSSSTSS